MKSEDLDSLSRVFEDDLSNHLASVRSELGIYGYAIMLGTQDAQQACAIAVSNGRDDLARFDDDYREEAKYIPDEWQNWHHDAFPKFRERFGVFLKDFQQASPEWEEERRLISDLCELYLATAERVLANGGFGNIAYRVIWISDSQHPMVAESARKLNSRDVCAAAQCVFDTDLGG